MRRVLLTLLTGGVIASAACEDFLTVNPRNVISRENYFFNEEHMDEAVTRTYGIAANMFGNQFRLTGDLRGELVTLMLNVNVPGFTFQIDEFSEATNDGTIGGLYQAIFNTIFNANVVLSRIDDIPFADEAKRNRLKAEAYFARALAYWIGLQYWGYGDGEDWNRSNLAVPLVTREINDPDETFEIERGTVGEVFDLIVEDLKFAKQHLPIQAPEDEPQRFTRGAAAFLLGATYQLDPSSQMQQLALAEFEELDNYGYSLITVGSQEANFNAPREIFNPAIRFQNPEVILYFNGGTIGTTSTAPMNAGWGVAPATSNATRVQVSNGAGNGSFMPTQNHILSFAGANPDSPEDVFDLRYEGYYGAFCPGSGVSGVLGDVIDVYRTTGDVTLRFENPGYPEVNIEAVRDPINRTVRENCIGYFTKWRWPAGGSQSRMIFRYTDAVLRKAEALARLNRADEALVYVNQIRDRAGLPHLNGLSGQALLDAILQERAWEFGGEAWRWADLKRFGRGIEIIQAHGIERKNRVARTPDAAYMMLGATYRMRFPILPDDVRLSQCRILQNPGWAADCVGQ